ncbi:MAG: AraC family transcriptional regulator [Devosia sp.]
MDPLSDVLALLKPRSYVSAGFDAGGDWSIQFPRNGGIKCYAVQSGQCWMAVEGIADPVRLQAGDCFLLPAGRPFRLASDLALTPVDAEGVFAPAREGGVARCNGGGDFFLVGSRFLLTGNAGILLGLLPPIVHIKNQSDQAALRWSVERMMQELRERQPGGFLMAEHLAHMMLVQALRLHMTEGAGTGVGWLFALADKQMGAAINAMHANPAERWTLQGLAERAGMSRSSFALKFKAAVGTPPMDYLTRWRMLLAGDRLENTRDPTAVIALSLGYESESAFSTAFKRVMGRSPRQYGRHGSVDTAESS